MRPYTFPSQCLAVACVLGIPAAVSAQPPADSGHVRVGPGVHLRYVARGTGMDTVVVPLAAWMARSMEPLTHDHVVVSYDPRGRGGSTAPGDSNAYGWQRDVADLELLRRELGLGRFALVGHGYYAAVAALYAAAHPEHVSRLVMVAPQRAAFSARYTHRLTSRQRPDSMAIAALTALRRAGGEANDPPGFCRADLFGRLLPSLMGEPDLSVGFRDDPCVHSNEWPTRASIIAHFIGSANGRWDWRSRALRVRLPALVIHGMDDPISPAGAGRDWARRLPDARFLGILRAGHMPWLDGGPTFFDAVGTFLNGEWPTGAEVLRGDASR